MPYVVSVSSSTTSSPAGAENAGQPQPESYFASDVKSSVPQPAQLVDAVVEDVVVLAREGPLGPALAQHVVLLGRELCAPLGVGLLDPLRRAF